MKLDCPLLVVILIIVIFLIPSLKELGLILMVGYIIYMIYSEKKNIEKFVSIPEMDSSPRWIRNECPYMMNKTITSVLKDNDITRDNDNNNMIFPCTYDRIDNEMSKMKPKENDRVFIINNADQLASKNNIWTNMVNKYGRLYTMRYLPATYLLNNKQDKKHFEKEYTEQDVYILKKNLQQQKGLKVTRNLDEIINSKGYVLVQKMLQDPYLINDRKINMRVYLLVVCRGEDIACYAHKDGFMYYTKDPFKKYSTKLEEIITSGYIDREVYESSPLTLEDFRVYLDSSRSKTEYEQRIENKYKISQYVFNSIYEMLSKVMISIIGNICNDNKFKKCVTYQLFGCDVALDDELNAKLMEINKGPDMKPKDDRDREVKYNVMSDVFDLVKIKKKKYNRFIKLIDTDNGGVIEYIR